MRFHGSFLLGAAVGAVSTCMFLNVLQHQHQAPTTSLEAPSPPRHRPQCKHCPACPGLPLPVPWESVINITLIHNQGGGKHGFQREKYQLQVHQNGSMTGSGLVSGCSDMKPACYRADPVVFIPSYITTDFIARVKDVRTVESLYQHVRQYMSEPDDIVRPFWAPAGSGDSFSITIFFTGGGSSSTRLTTISDRHCAPTGNCGHAPWLLGEGINGWENENGTTPIEKRWVILDEAPDLAWEVLEPYLDFSTTLKRGETLHDLGVF